jgi:hypothetical protein
MNAPEGITRRQALRRVGVLLGGIVSAPTVAGVLGGCEPTSGSNWTPETLTAEQSERVDTIAEIIIPATDTPGASAAQVNRFVDAMLTESYPPKTRDRFLKGLTSTNARCREDYGAPLLELSAEQQRALVGELDAETFGAEAPDEVDRENPSFFRMMKELTIVGYYTSEIGATQELKTNIGPGYHDGDVPYEDIGRTWSGAAS